MSLGSLNKFNNLNPNFNISEIGQQRISIEYLKNVLLKYLEAISIGNEFQTKILENVIFTILNVSQADRAKLEEKRNKSSFYYNLWYNAKAFLSAKIYGPAQGELQTEESAAERTNENLKIDTLSHGTNKLGMDKSKSNSLDDLNIVKEKKNPKLNEV